MLLSNFTYLVFVSVTIVHAHVDLSFPQKYHFEITKYNIASGLVENITVWKTERSSRIEYNNGAVISVIIAARHRLGRGIHVEIHPESNDEEQPKIVCKTKWCWDDPEDILPNTNGFKEVGSEMMHGKKCTKFVKVATDITNDKLESTETLWAESKLDVWVPVRYTKEIFNSWLGYLDRRDMWDFEAYDYDFDETKVFNVDNNICSDNNTVSHSIDDPSVTKDLLFVNPDNEEHVNHVFESYRKTYNKTYSNEDMLKMRKMIFKRNLRLIKERNRQKVGYKLSVNQFADQTPEEMKRHMGLKKRPEGKVGTHPFPYTTEHLKEETSKLPSTYDLRIEGVISPVQNQETCGSCWTFGTTSAVEGALARRNGGNLKRLSNQALIDCAWKYGAHGCGGGSDTAAYEFMMDYGMPTIAEYGEYANQDGFCHINNVTETIKIRGFVDVTPNSIQALKVALVNHGPLSVSVEATDAFILYSGGVFYDFKCNATSVNHEVTLVGYGEEFGETFWIIKNSWGPNWGISGYMHIAAKENNCGIMTEPTYVLI